jgi:hypothetical protein
MHWTEHAGPLSLARRTGQGAAVARPRFDPEFADPQA